MNVITYPYPKFGRGWANNLLLIKWPQAQKVWRAFHKEGIRYSLACFGYINNPYHVISMTQCKTTVTPLLTHWSYCSLALSHWYICFIHTSCFTDTVAIICFSTREVILRDMGDIENHNKTQWNTTIVNKFGMFWDNYVIYLHSAQNFLYRIFLRYVKPVNSNV